MKRSILLIRNVAPKMYGGGETYQLKLAQLLRESSFEPFIVSSSRGLLMAAEENNLKTINAPYIERQDWSGWKNILFPVYLVKIMKLRKWYKAVFEKYDPKVINVQSRDDWIAATVVAKKMGIKVLWTDHMDLRSWVLTNVGIWYKNWIGKWVLKSAKRADAIIMISDYERKCFEKVIAPRKMNNLVTIKNGAIDQYDDFKGKKCKKNSICYIGRIVDYKGIGELLEAFETVRNKYPDAELNIYGDGDKLEEYKKQTSLNVKFYGRTDEPLEKLAENEIFVLPSYREGLSLSLLDAAMMKKEIIASDVDGNLEVVVDEKTGLLVPPKNAKKLAEAIIYMLEHKEEAKKMAKEARCRYEDNFNFKRIFEEKMLTLYNGGEEKK